MHSSTQFPDSRGPFFQNTTVRACVLVPERQHESETTIVSSLLLCITPTSPVCFCIAGCFPSHLLTLGAFISFQSGVLAEWHSSAEHEALGCHSEVLSIKGLLFFLLFL